jgi:serine/threonine protein kinase
MKDIWIEALGPDRCFIVDKRQGGFGDVLLLSEDGKSPSHAIKLLKIKESSQATLKSEAARLATLSPHRNIVEIEAVTETELGTGILMPYYPSSLRDLIRDRPKLDAVLSTAVQMAQGLQHLHGHGILHLDLKPENVLLSSDGTPALSDFGISKVVERPDLKKNPTLEVALPAISGTLKYMAPEQLLSTVVSVKTDVFAFGVILYEAVTGHHPFSGDIIQEYASSLLSSPVNFSVPERLMLPGWLRNLIMQTLEKSPADRPMPSAIIDIMNTQKCGFSQRIEDADRLIRDINRAGALSAVGDNQGALSLLQAAITSDPWNLTARINLAEVYFIMGNIDKAIECGQVAYELIPWCLGDAGSEQVIYLNLSLYLMTQDPRRSYSLTKKAIGLYPKNWELLHNHAEACRLLGVDSPSTSLATIEEGISCAERALALSPKDESLRITYAGLLRLGKHRARFIPYLAELMKEVGEHSVPARLLFLEAHLDEGNLAFVENQIRELSEFKAFNGLLEGVKRRVVELRQYKMNK